MLAKFSWGSWWPCCKLLTFDQFIFNLLVRSFNHRLNITLKYNEIMWPWTIFNTIQSQTKVVINKSWVYSICVEKSSLFTLIRPSLNINWFSNLFCFWCQDWKVTCISYFNLVHVCVIMCIIDYFFKLLSDNKAPCFLHEHTL